MSDGKDAKCSIAPIVTYRKVATKFQLANRKEYVSDYQISVLTSRGLGIELCTGCWPEEQLGAGSARCWALAGEGRMDEALSLSRGILCKLNRRVGQAYVPIRFLSQKPGNLVRGRF
jgi:hypothetical protein